MIKRIMKFIPNSEYNKIYDALFKSHLSYCISSWGAIPNYKLNQPKKDVFDYYLVLSTHMTMLDNILHVHKYVPKYLWTTHIPKKLLPRAYKTPL